MRWQTVVFPPPEEPTRATVDPARTVMIGNDDEADCRGAAAVGLDSCYVATEQSPALTRPLPENCRVLRVIADAMDLV